MKFCPKTDGLRENRIKFGLKYKFRKLFLVFLSLFVLVGLFILIFCRFKVVDVINVAFSPYDDMRSIVIDEMAKANKELIVVNFKFNDLNVAEGVVKAKERGVDVKVLIDIRSLCRMSDSSVKSVPDFFKEKNISTFIFDDRPDILHQKVILRDKEYVAFGSANFFVDDLNYNLENMIFVRSEWLYAKFRDEFDDIISSGNVMSLDSIKNTSVCEGTSNNDEGESKVTENFNNEEYSNIRVEDVLFGPKDNLLAMFIEKIRETKSVIIVMESVLNNKAIIDELLGASKRNVKIYVLTNLAQFNEALFGDTEIKVKFFDKNKQGMLHNKFIIVDGENILVGSVNLFDRSLNGDLENLIVFDSDVMCRMFEDYFWNIWRSGYIK